MRSFKFTIDFADGRRIWINLMQMLKMEKLPDSRYFIYLINGEKYEIDKKTARDVENYFEGR